MNTHKFSPRMIIALSLIALFSSSACRVASEVEKFAGASPFAFTGIVVLVVAFGLAFLSGSK